VLRTKVGCINIGFYYGMGQFFKPPQDTILLSFKS
jgi:hypothetical protein